MIESRWTKKNFRSVVLLILAMGLSSVCHLGAETLIPVRIADGKGWISQDNIHKYQFRDCGGAEAYEPKQVQGDTLFFDLGRKTRVCISVLKGRQEFSFILDRRADFTRLARFGWHMDEGLLEPERKVRTVSFNNGALDRPIELYVRVYEQGKLSTWQPYNGYGPEYQLRLDQLPYYRSGGSSHSQFYQARKYRVQQNFVNLNVTNRITGDCMSILNIPTDSLQCDVNGEPSFLDIDFLPGTIDYAQHCRRRAHRANMAWYYETVAYTDGYGRQIFVKGAEQTPFNPYPTQLDAPEAIRLSPTGRRLGDDKLELRFFVPGRNFGEYAVTCHIQKDANGPGRHKLYYQILRFKVIPPDDEMPRPENYNSLSYDVSKLVDSYVGSPEALLKVALPFRGNYELVPEEHPIESTTQLIPVDYSDSKAGAQLIMEPVKFLQERQVILHYP